MLWKEFTLCIRRKHVRRIEKVLTIKRLKHLKKIRLNKLCLNNATDNATIFNVIALIKETVKELVIRGSDLSKVSPDVIGPCLNSGTKLNLFLIFGGLG